ncbi:MAG: hypothetical protein OJF47_001291 [Nitrospira sp.]|nr:MAG: hypothetical protein OJF47_001291 [Nitrospira sp.]
MRKGCGFVRLVRLSKKGAPCSWSICETDMNDHALISPAGKDVRCLCGKLTARLEKRGVVVKCNRCGELVVIALTQFKEHLDPSKP